MSLAENIKRAREERGVSQEYVAGRLQVSRQAVSKWETGQSEPSTQNLLQLARLLEVDVNVLLHRGGAGRRAVRQAPEQRGLVTVLSRRNAMLLSASCAAQMAIFCVNQGQITRSKDIMALFSGLFMVLLLGNVWLTVEKVLDKLGR